MEEMRQRYDMSDKGTLLKLLKELLDGIGLITKQDADDCTELIRNHLKQSKKSKLKSMGLCLNCKETEIIYGELCHTHQQKGDSWLADVFTNWFFPPKLTFDDRSIKINGYRHTTVIPYVCENCSDEIEGLIKDVQEKIVQQQNHDALESKQYELDVISGERQATPAKRYWLLQFHVSKEETERLKRLPYKEFLNSYYWKIVRNYLVYKRGYKCELCAIKGDFNVHHKTYENRGEEHKHLEDLILLCRICHAKFHDKLEEPHDHDE